MKYMTIALKSDNYEGVSGIIAMTKGENLGTPYLVAVKETSQNSTECEVSATRRHKTGQGERRHRHEPTRTSPMTRSILVLTRSFTFTLYDWAKLSLK